MWWRFSLSCFERLFPCTSFRMQTFPVQVFSGVRGTSQYCFWHLTASTLNPSITIRLRVAPENFRQIVHSCITIIFVDADFFLTAPVLGWNRSGRRDQVRPKIVEIEVILANFRRLKLSSCFGTTNRLIWEPVMEAHIVLRGNHALWDHTLPCLGPAHRPVWESPLVWFENCKVSCLGTIHRLDWKWWILPEVFRCTCADNKAK